MKDQPNLEIHPLRYNNHYVLWYRNIAVLIVTLVIPLVLLAYWNFNTLLVIIRRRRLRNRPSLPDAMNLIRQTAVSLDITGNVTEVIKIPSSTSIPSMTSLVTGGQIRTDIKSRQGIYSLSNCSYYLTFILFEFQLW